MAVATAAVSAAAGTLTAGSPVALVTQAERKVAPESIVTEMKYRRKEFITGSPLKRRCMWSTYSLSPRRQLRSDWSGAVMKSTSILRVGVALLPLALALPAAAQDTAEAGATTAAAAQAMDSEEIVVTAELFFRNRTLDPNPVLSYDLEYFQRFEPVSVGEM
ncbi:MAG: hypothetical protein Q7J32_12955, partial [Sphingomonadaceae bacterium]|nr:hypothetical protein [Sphingomonadaceae bacterium]